MLPAVAPWIEHPGQPRHPAAPTRRKPAASKIGMIMSAGIARTPPRTYADPRPDWAGPMLIEEDEE